MIDLNASSSEIVVIKNADESRVNTTLTNDTELLFPTEANCWYAFELHLQVTGSVGLGGMRLGLVLPAGAEAVANARTNTNTTINAASNAGVMSSLIPAANTLATQIATVSGKVRISSTAGNVVVSWAQNTTAGTDPVTIKAGSKLIYKKV